jgi:hypothetical protein
MVVNATGRDFAEIEMTMYFDPETCLWTVDEGIIESVVSPERKAIQRALQEFGEMTIKQVSDRIAIPLKPDGTPAKTPEQHYDNIKKLLSSMDGSNEAVKVGRGIYKAVSSIVLSR